MKRNKEFIVAGIKNLLKRNYGIDPSTIDVEALVDSELDYGENWTIIKEFIMNRPGDYDYFKCKRCEKKIMHNWKYCPMCGMITFK